MAAFEWVLPLICCHYRYHRTDYRKDYLQYDYDSGTTRGTDHRHYHRHYHHRNQSRCRMLQSMYTLVTATKPPLLLPFVFRKRLGPPRVW